MRQLSIVALLASTSLVSLSNRSLAAVYPTCDIPPNSGSFMVSSSNHYVAPSADDTIADGTEARPYSLNSLFVAGSYGSPRLAIYPFWHAGTDGIWAWSADPNSPIKSGDTILLKSGNYGDLTIGVYGQNIVNPQFITFTAAPDAKPIFSRISVHDPIERLQFTNITFRHASPSSGALVDVSAGTNIIFDHVDIASVEDNVSLAATTPVEWLSHVTRDGFKADGRYGASCVTLSNSNIHSTLVGVSVSTPKSLVIHNDMAYIGHDFIDIAADNLAIIANHMHDTINVDDHHNDVIQGQAPGSSFAHIIIDSNSFFRKLNSQNKLATYRQGIAAFDGGWRDVRITRNIIATGQDSCWGLVWGATAYGLFAQNTIILDGPSGDICYPRLAPFQSTHDFPVGDHVVSVNNIQVEPMGDPVPPYSLETGNVMSGYDPSSIFARWEPNNLTYDLHLKPGSPAIGAGIADAPELQALAQEYPETLVLPAKDIEGNPYDPVHPSAGAYTYQETTTPVPPICTSAPGCSCIPICRK